MKRITALLISALIFSSCTPKTKLASVYLEDHQGVSQTITSKDRLKQYSKVNFETNQPYRKVVQKFKRDQGGSINSVVSSYYENGQVMQVLKVHDGRAQGIYKEWHPNGKKKVEAQVMGGTPDLSESAQKSWIFEGLSRAWDDEGLLEAEINYFKGKKEGVARRYHTTGAIWQEMTYDKDRLEGPHRTYMESGEVLSVQTFKKGFLDGTSTRYWPGGELASKEEFKSGRLTQGEYYTSSGERISEVEDGSGMRVIFGKTEISEKQTYVQGIQKGRVEYYLSNGVLWKSTEFDRGLKHGEEVLYYTPFDENYEKESQVKISLHWFEGCLQGTVKTWFPDGKLESQRQLFNNQIHGPYTAYYEDGNLMVLEEYDHGKLVRGEYFKKGIKDPVSKVRNGAGTATLFKSDGSSDKEIPYKEGAPFIEDTRELL